MIKLNIICLKGNLTLQL